MKMSSGILVQSERRLSIGRIVRGLVLSSLLILVTSCGGSGPTPEDDMSAPQFELWPAPTAGGTVTERTGCDVLTGPTTGGAELVVALGEKVDIDRAPIPHNSSERILFAQLYETLVNVDCDGNVRPGLAESWTCSEDSAVWVFRLREGARFWDGTRVTAADVLRAWNDNQDCPRSAQQSSPWTWLDARARTVTAPDARRVAIRLPEPQTRFPLLLAHPAMAVSTDREGWTWPVGSGPCRLRATDPAPRPDLVCRPNVHHPSAPVWKSLTFRITPGVDPRDLAASQADLTIVRENSDVRFYDDLPGYTTQPLPWNRLYLLVMPPESNPRGSHHWRAAADRIVPESDVTRVAARSWSDVVLPAGADRHCPQVSGPVATEGSARLEWGLESLKLDPQTVIYPAEDAGARELAQRLAALAGGAARAVELPADGLSFALQWQMSGAGILPLDLDFPTGCLQLANLLGKAAWLQEAALGPEPVPVGESLGDAERLAPLPFASPAETLLDRGVVRPLGLTHAWLVVRGDLAGLALDYDGTPRLAGLGPAVDGDLP